MMAILLLLNISGCVKNLANSRAISGDLRLATDISEQQSHQPDTSEAP